MRMAAPAPNESADPRQPCVRMPGREQAVHRRLAAPGVAGVHDVVVHERARVQQLERRGRGVNLRAVLAARRAPAPVAERRAQPLAAGQQPGDRVHPRQHVRADVAERPPLAVEEVVQGPSHLGPDRGKAGLLTRLVAMLARLVRRRDRSGRACPVGRAGEWGAEDPEAADSDGSRRSYGGVARRPRSGRRRAIPASLWLCRRVSSPPCQRSGTCWPRGLRRTRSSSCRPRPKPRNGSCGGRSASWSRSGRRSSR